jgi:hypothetical protein
MDLVLRIQIKNLTSHRRRRSLRIAGVIEIYNKTGKKWLGKYRPTTGKLIDGTSKATRVASFLGKGINYVFNRLSILTNILIYTGPGSGLENFQKPIDNKY